MKTLACRIESRRQALGLSKTDIWKPAGLSSGAYSHWMNGGELSGENLVKVAKILKVSADWLATGRGDPENNNSIKNYPRVVGTAHMGDKGYYLDLDGGDGYLEFEAEDGAIAIHVRGDSMFPAIRDGWYIVLEPSGRPQLNEYVLLKFANGRNMVKELLQIKNDCYVVMSVNTGERITAMKVDLVDIKGISAIVPPSKHKDF